jgi:hypothetical protein
MAQKPGSNTGKNGGIYQEVGPRGSQKDNYATVKDNDKLPLIIQPGNEWKLIKRTPDSKRK